MDRIIYESLNRYYHTLESIGYISDVHTKKLLVLCFYKDFITNDYKNTLSKDDYMSIEKALYCLYGTSCLIPYPDYLKMNKIYLGQLSELSRRIKVLEETPVLKIMQDVENSQENPDSDIIIVQSED